MWDYSEKVQDHFYHPRNAGAVEDANAIGEVGSIACGDALRLSLKVDPATETILEAGFQTFGCGSAIASSSALTEIVKGKTLDEALTVSNQDIAEYLDGLPPEKMHCSVMGREALAAAVANYRGETWRDEHEEGALVCACFGVDSKLIERTVRTNNLSTLTDVINYTKAGGGCTCCHEAIEALLGNVLAERDESSSPEPEAAGAMDSSAPRLTNLERIRRIEKVIEAVRPALLADHGDIELVEVDGKTIYVTTKGACTGCQMEAMTLSGVQQRLVEELKEFVKVVPAKAGHAA